MDIREQAIHEYLVEGKTYRQLAKKYNIGHLHKAPTVSGKYIDASFI